MAEQNEPKKVIIDEDWKNQAQKEKETLEEKVEQAEETGSSRQLPPADFEGLVSIFTTQAYLALGLIRPQEDQDKDIEPDFELAKFNIDLLGMLETKCKGNLTDDEQKILQGSLNQLRMIFVQLSRGA
ncbi:MAG TPA: DUF1844 domain-containing protein [Anaerohalosphaeraceae bacterium]|nr:DUF1844 domain-containing protein [Anaerohalosphaeraceae bacterium]